jgi:small-conductance mechanosensitive channel
MDITPVFEAFGRPIVELFPKLPEALLDFAVGYVIIKILIWLLDHFLRLTKQPKIKGIIISLAKMALWLILFIVIANNMGFNRLAVAISGSVLILAFILNNGLAPLVSDALSGIFLCADQDFKPGSRIRIGKGKEAMEAELIEVDMRKVRFIDDKGLIHVFPNSKVDKEEWVVVSKPETRSLKTAVAAKELIKRKLKKNG